MTAKPKDWREMLPLAEAVMRRDEFGCCWYTVIDGQNCLESAWPFCAEKARASGHPECVAFESVVMAASKTQRRKLTSEIAHRKEDLGAYWVRHD